MMNEFKVGLFAVLAIIAVVYMSLRVTMNQSGFGEYQTYRTIVDDASGIFAKTPIKVAGISAGRIKAIELQGNRALVTFEVLRKIKITKDSILRIRSVGLLGDKFLEITVGDSDELLASDALVPSETGGGIENLARDVAEVVSDVKKIVSEFKAALAPVNQESPIQRIVRNIEAVSTDAREAAAMFRRVLAQNEARLNQMVANLESFAQKANYQLDGSHKDSFMASLHEVMDEAKLMANDLQEVVANLKQGKGSLGRIMVEEDIADDVKQTLSGVKKMVGRVDQIKSQISVFAGTGNDGGRTDATYYLHTSPERFYAFGITSASWSPAQETETITTTDGVRSVEYEEKRSKSKFRINAQIGRRFQNWAVRLGMIESSGGVGIDYNLNFWPATLSAEVYDQREHIGPNVRLATEFRLWNVFYGKAMVDDVAQKDRRSASVAAGLKFYDDDLKSLLSFLW